MGRVVQSLSETLELWFRCTRCSYDSEGADSASGARKHIRQNPTHSIDVRRTSRSVISWEE